ncbi:MAG: tRNA (guanosine(46)-N7)-methyltransferase TrmB [Bacteroidetes bacterium]|nr:MAG: tRNA (guanosine(46)-N7)-methyltransferase TrmB [Bacteroidota bacterium]
MARKKLIRFADNEIAKNVIESNKSLYSTVKGNWNKDFFHNDNPITLELACGRGEYSVGLAKQYPDRNFVGVDVKGDRFWVGSNEATENKLENVCFLRTYIQNLEQFFAPKEVNRIWIVFPDPRPKEGDRKRRLTSTRFLSMYQRMMPEGGWIHFKTDNEPLFDFSLQQIAKYPTENLEFTRDLYNSPLAEDHFGITTKYEKIFENKGFKINYVKFFLKGIL